MLVYTGTSNYILFFFSSRRRHTRLVSDWSSDVCSSDLVDFGAAAIVLDVGLEQVDRNGPLALGHEPARHGQPLGLGVDRGDGARPAAGEHRGAEARQEERDKSRPHAETGH